MNDYTTRDKKNYGDTDVSKVAYPKFLEEIANMKEKNIAVEILKKCMILKICAMTLQILADGEMAMQNCFLNILMSWMMLWL